MRMMRLLAPGHMYEKRTLQQMYQEFVNRNTVVRRQLSTRIAHLIKIPHNPQYDSGIRDCSLLSFRIFLWSKIQNTNIYLPL